jgi:hypothetical protein
MSILRRGNSVTSSSLGGMAWRQTATRRASICECGRTCCRADNSAASGISHGDAAILFSAEAARCMGAVARAVRRSPARSLSPLFSRAITANNRRGCFRGGGRAWQQTSRARDGNRRSRRPDRWRLCPLLSMGVYSLCNHVSANIPLYILYVSGGEAGMEEQAEQHASPITYIFSRVWRSLL